MSGSLEEVQGDGRVDLECTQLTQVFLAAEVLVVEVLYDCLHYPGGVVEVEGEALGEHPAL